VVIAIIAILAALLLPVLSRAKQRAQGVMCLNNGKQMMLAMTLYSGENNDFFPPNPDDGNTIPGYNWCSGQAGINGADEFNTDILKDPTRSLLIKYLGGNVAVFRCPADFRAGGQPAARTFSMNQAVGTIDPQSDLNPQAGPSSLSPPHSGVPNLSVNGPWLNNQGNHRRNSPWFTYGKASDIRAPSPSSLWVLVDEDANGLNDAAFAFGMEQATWYDAPGIYHNGGCGFAFADGHSETHHWLSKGEKGNNGTGVADDADYQDWLWMQQRTSADSTGKMTTPPPP